MIFLQFGTALHAVDRSTTLCEMFRGSKSACLIALAGSSVLFDVCNRVERERNNGHGECDIVGVASRIWRDAGLPAGHVQHGRRLEACGDTTACLCQ